eukprot:2119781-Pleurochrysis_carterae.AAC.1
MFKWYSAIVPQCRSSGQINAVRNATTSTGRIPTRIYMRLAEKQDQVNKACLFIVHSHGVTVAMPCVNRKFRIH